MRAQLRALAGGADHPLEDFNLIGRSDEANIRLADAGVSRQHATIRREGSHFWLVDLGSANGSYVNDMALTTARVLKDGDRLQFGTSIFLFDQHENVHPSDTTTALGMKTQVLKQTPIPVKTSPVTMLVGDLRGFTQLSSQITAERVAQLLQEWYSDCNVIMKQQGGMIDQFIGDCVFAYWPGIDMPTRSRALVAAKSLRGDVLTPSPIRQMLKETKNIELDCRVGLHLGSVALGAMGKGINTALGDAVNIAFRIESLTRPLNVGILASRAFVDGWASTNEVFHPLGSHEVRGHPEKIEVYSVK